MRSYINTLASTAMPSVKTIPAMPDSVRAAWNEASTPTVKKMLNTSARLATMPGMMPYMAHI